MIKPCGSWEGVWLVSMIRLKSPGSFLKPLTGPSRNPLLTFGRILGKAFEPVNEKMRKNIAYEIGIVNEEIRNWHWSGKRGLGWYEEKWALIYPPRPSLLSIFEVFPFSPHLLFQVDLRAYYQISFSSFPFLIIDIIAKLYIPNIAAGAERGGEIHAFKRN